MKILIVAPTHRSFIAKILNIANNELLPEGYGGAPFIGNIIEELLKRGHEVISVTTSTCFDNDYNIKSFTYKNFRWIVVPSRKRSFGFNGMKMGRIVDFFLLEQKAMTKVINTLKPDIVHAHWSYEFAASAIKSKSPFIITVHDNHWKVLQYMPNLYRFFRAIMAERNLGKVRSITTVSPYMKSYFSKKIEEVSIVPNPIKINYDKKHIKTFIKNKLLSVSNPSIIIINNGWKGRKNGLFGLEVLNELRKKIPKVSMHIIGSGSEIYGPAYKDAVKLGVASLVKFHGVVTNDHLFELLKDIHIMLHPAKEESFGVVLGEAASMGVPVFGYYKAGAVPWVINDSSLLFSDWDPLLVAKQILDLLSQKTGYEEKCLEVYDKVINSFSLDKIVTDYESHYKIKSNDSIYI